MKRQRLRYFTAGEKDKLLRYLEQKPEARRSEMMYKLMFATGLRLRETVNLNVGDLRGKETLVVIGKGNKEREIPLSQAIRQEIEKFLTWKNHQVEATSPEAPLFISRKRRRLGSRAVQHDLDKWVRLAGIYTHVTKEELRDCAELLSL